MTSLALAAGLFASGAPRGASAEETCPPIPKDAAGTSGPAGTLAEPGVSASPASAADRAFRALPSAAPAPISDRVPGEALLVLPKGADGRLPGDFEIAADARIADSFFSPVICSTVVRIVGPPGRPPGDLVARVPASALVAPNHVFRTAADAVRPIAAPPGARGPDPYLPLQHGFARVGAAAARGVSSGAGVRIAVLDSAPDVSHVELRRIRVSPVEKGPSTAPGLHGTLVAGVVAAIENNGFGIAGVSPASEVLAIPVCTPGGTSDECRTSDLVRGLDLAWNESARVVTLALVGPPDPLVERAVERLASLGVLVVAAAGNEGVDAPRYPAAYPTVIGVGAMDAKDRPWPRSNRGASVKLSAPGVEIVSTLPGQAFGFADGTSLAAAHVAGMLGILSSVSDRPDLVRAALRPGSGEPLPRLCDALATLGRPCPAP